MPSLPTRQSSIFMPKKSVARPSKLARNPLTRQNTEQRRKSAMRSFTRAELKAQRPVQEIFGAVAGIEPGASWNTREECSKAGVHRPSQDGISGNPRDGAASIVLSGRYETDIDMGDTIIYTGTGGHPRDAQIQVADQDPDQKQNKALETSLKTQSPVRVIRGYNGKNEYSPRRGYRYDGLYTVVESKMHCTDRGFKVCLFRLERIEGQRPLESYI